MQSAIGAHDPRWAEHCRITGAVRRPGDRNPRIIVLRRKGGPSPTLEVLVAR